MPALVTDRSGVDRKFFRPAFFISPISIHIVLVIIMTTYIRCRGCGTEYTPRGLSQHVSKTRDVRCQHAPMQPIASRAPVVPSTIHHTTMAPSLNPISSPPFSIIDTQNELVNGIQISDGALQPHHFTACI